VITMEKKPIFIEVTYDPEDDVLKLEASDHPMFAATSVSNIEFGAITYFKGSENEIFKVIINHFLDDPESWKCAFYQIMSRLPEEFVNEIKKARTGFRYVLTLMIQTIESLKNEVDYLRQYDPTKDY